VGVQSIFFFVREYHCCKHDICSNVGNGYGDRVAYYIGCFKAAKIASRKVFVDTKIQD